ncbi:MAG: phage tail protein [Candidatus Kapaibacterium sp.]
MSVQLPNGVTIALATAYGSPKTVSALTNANPGVATSATHGLTSGDIIEVTSGWAKLNSRIVRVDDEAAGTFAIEGIDTTSTVAFPAGSGTGSVREITTFTQITQIMDVTTSGGDMQFVNYSFLEQDFETQLPTQSSPMTMTIQIADDPSLPGYQAAKAAGEDRAVRALKITYPSGAVAYYNGYVSFNETPTFTKNQIQVVTATFNLLARPTRYAA